MKTFIIVLAIYLLIGLIIAQIISMKWEKGDKKATEKEFKQSIAKDLNMTQAKASQVVSSGKKSLLSTFSLMRLIIAIIWLPALMGVIIEEIRK